MGIHQRCGIIGGKSVGLGCRVYNSVRGCGVSDTIEAQGQALAASAGSGYTLEKHSFNGSFWEPRGKIQFGPDEK